MSYSARTEAWLIVAGQRHELGSVGLGFCYARQPLELPADTEATLVLSVDDEEFRWLIRVLRCDDTRLDFVTRP
jgi:hypothetical protein